MEKESNFVWFNFRGKIRFLRKDTIEMIPFLNNLITSKCSSVERCPSGHIMIDEDYNTIVQLVNVYVKYIHSGRISAYSTTFAYAALRLGCESKFTDLLLRIDDDHDSRMRRRRRGERDEASNDNHKIMDYGYVRLKPNKIKKTEQKITLKNFRNYRIDMIK